MEPGAPPRLLAVDHLVYAAPTLDGGIEAVRRLLGVEPAPGGRHPRWRTRNALVGLGRTTYLEIIGPAGEIEEGGGSSVRGSGAAAPESRAPALEAAESPADAPEPRPFGIDTLASPRLVAWAARAAPLEAVIRSARSAGLDPGTVMAGSREAPDGSVLRWRLTDPTIDRDGGSLPFLIDWGDSPHPAESLDHPCALRRLRVRHPEPGRIRSFLRPLHPRVVVESGPEPEIAAVLDTPSGRVTLAPTRPPAES